MATELEQNDGRRSPSLYCRGCVTDRERAVAGGAPLAAAEEGPGYGPRFSYAVGALDRSIRRSLGTALEPFGLTLPEYTALSLLRIRDGYSNAQLARRSFVSPQAMHEVIRSLESRGLLERTRSSSHRSIRHTHLTRKGRELLGRCDDAVDGMEETMMADIPPERRLEAISLLLRAARRLGELGDAD